MIKLNLPQIDPSLAMMFISLAIAISALPGGLFANKYGNHRAMLIGIISVLLSLLILVFLPTTIAISLAILPIVLCFSLVTNGAIPLAIDLFPADRTGLAVGIYFGAFSAGISSFSAIFNPATNLTPVLGAIVGSIALIIAGGCVWKSRTIN
jgi:MFS family permease